VTTSIFFDLDGTLCDPRDGIVRCLQYAFEKLGHAPPPSEELVHYVGPPLYESFAALLSSNDPKLIEQAVNLYRERFSSTGIFENTLYAGIPDALRKLKSRDYRLNVVTSKPTTFARQIIAYLELEGFFQRVYGSELDGTRAGKTELIAHVLEQEKIRPRNAVMIGDREHDVKGALANGVRPIGVLWGYGSSEELIQAGATVLCQTPQSILEQLG
jgi:phosphoglycolate phosphatase